MSIIVKGMKMPKDCLECTGTGLNIGVSVFGSICPFCEKIQTDHDMKTGRHPDCPLGDLREKHGRLVDADAFMDTINRNCYPVQHDMTSIEPGMTRMGILQVIQEQPTIEPQRKKGKWIPVTKIYKVTEGQFPNTHIEWVDATEPDEIDAVRCSECREVFDFQDARNWCSECGADMRTPVEIARNIVHKVIDKSVWSDTVDTAKMHKIVDDKYAEMTKKTEESKRCDTCKHERSRWFSRCADCSDYELWEGKECQR